MPAGPWSGLEFAAILAPGGDPATDMSLCFVFVQNFLDLEIQAPVVEGKPFLYVFMYSTFADAELLGGVTYSGTVLDDIGGQFAGPLLDITLQDPTRSLSRYAPYICRTKWRHA